MQNQVRLSPVPLILLTILLLVLTCSCQGTRSWDDRPCKPSGKVRGMKPPSGHCNTEDDCCIPGRYYTTYRCSPPVANQTKATLTLNSFEKGGDGSSPSKCDGRYHSDHETVVALSTGWFNHRSRCLKFIDIHGSNGENVKAKVVDECDSANGCDSHHDYQPPCGNNVVVASMAVWKALKVPLNQWGDMDIYWSDA